MLVLGLTFDKMLGHSPNAHSVSSSFFWWMFENPREIHLRMCMRVTRFWRLLYDLGLLKSNSHLLDEKKPARVLSAAANIRTNCQAR